jgi:autonomous glycyl radical cofactor GrcA
LREFAVDRFVPETEPDPLADALEDEEDEKDEEAREVDARVELAARAVKGATELGTTSHHSISATVRPEVLLPF